LIYEQLRLQGEGAHLQYENAEYDKLLDELDAIWEAMSTDERAIVECGSVKTNLDVEKRIWVAQAVTYKEAARRASLLGFDRISELCTSLSD
jgi:hypothetical protein